MDQQQSKTSKGDDQLPGHTRKGARHHASTNGHDAPRIMDEGISARDEPTTLDAHSPPARQSSTLDQFAEGAFDPLTRLAAHALHTPAALLVALDADAARIVSQFGLDADSVSLRQLPRDDTPWDEIIASATGAFWDDVRRDDVRRHKWSLPTIHGGAPVVALGGAVVTGAGGDALAALCVLDDRPHVWTDQDREILGDVATTVRERLALRRAVRQAEGQAETRLAVQYAVSRILVSATDFETAAPRILHAVCEGLRWQLGAIWLVDEREEALRCAWTWHAPGVEVQSFERASREVAFAPGAGIPGQVYASRASLWLSDLARARNFPRMSEAAQAGLRSAFAFPIRGGGNVLGVGEFFATETRPVDDDLIQNVATIGNQIGQFLIRQRAESAERSSEARRGAIQD
ncbi:MAG: GAF domain-containing protein, partial [Ktedonobacterales bacterium]